jgi:hypothetical protein
VQVSPAPYVEIILYSGGDVACERMRDADRPNFTD